MQTVDPPLVSLVTPVHNGEKYIGDCIQSVCSQTYQNWEYIILNNCSTDRTLAIAEKYAMADRRIRLLNTDDLLPIISNHNHAVKQISADSRYCKIIHADDMLLPNCVELMVAAAERHPTAGMVGSYCIWGDKVVPEGIPLATTFFSGRELCRLTLLNKLYCFWSPSALLLKSDIIRKRGDLYHGDHLHADDEACYEILQAYDFAFVHQVLTFIRRHAESATATITASYNKLLLSNFDLYLRYGPCFLSPHEYESHLNVKKNRYYRFLASSLFDLREVPFWRYHRQELKKIGLSFSVYAFLKAILSKLANSPVATARQFAGAVNKSFATLRRSDA